MLTSACFTHCVGVELADSLGGCFNQIGWALSLSGWVVHPRSVVPLSSSMLVRIVSTRLVSARPCTLTARRFNWFQRGQRSLSSSLSVLGQRRRQRRPDSQLVLLPLERCTRFVLQGDLQCAPFSSRTFFLLFSSLGGHPVLEFALLGGHFTQCWILLCWVGSSPTA